MRSHVVVFRRTVTQHPANSENYQKRYLLVVMDQPGPYPVKVYIYDLSRGMARQMSPVMLGEFLAYGNNLMGYGVLVFFRHTGIVVYGKEFFFGGAGISSCLPGGTVLQVPDSIVDLGSTEVPVEIFMEYLSSLGESTFRGDKYNLFEHNCNTFSNEVSQFLTGKKIPSYITDLPSEVMSTPFGQALRPFLESISVNPGSNNITGQR
ncbi:hypothetical protein L3Q82_010611 [Scortum barcoo]|uniref:Uncharacterized protein n=1 Tax=Scortum barcoo TaxID=214431 RepID=A0ACB8WCH9_9TELE|nr:hypothetical protein L3Q82_010611 [Scortum barcoo]